MMQRLRSLRRSVYGIIAAILSVAVLVPANMASAAQVTSRSVELSSSAASATANYLVSFTAPTAVQSIVMDFCSDSPIIGATCTAPTGMSLTSATLTVGTNTTGWVKNSSTANNFQLKNTTTPTTAGASLNFTITGATNPSTVGSFYARVYTYVSSTPGYTNATTLGTYADYGGFAMSTANTISISATVMETLTFCVSGAAPGTGCTSTTTPAVTLGHGSPAVIDSTQVDNNSSTTPTYTQISTNAQSGAIVRLKNSNTCGGLSSDGGTTCAIPAAGATPITLTNTNGGFGLYVNAGSGGTGTVTPNANYNDGTSTHYAMNTTNVTSAYGDAIESSSAPVSSVNNQLTFAAISKATTPAGVYTATMTLIATGTF